MRKHLIIAMLILVNAYAATTQEQGARTIPPAFPDARPHDLRTDTPPATALPGESPLPTPKFVVPAPPPANADWLLRRMAASEDPSVRLRASEAWPVSEALMEDMNVLVYALADSSDDVRAGAIRRLERLEPAQVFGYVMRTMVGGTLDRVRALDAALPALESTLTPFMLETLRTELESPMHRRIAAYCLGRTGALSAIETLGEYARNGDPVLSRACADALYAIGTSHTAEQWAMLLHHHDVYCRQLAVRALAVVGGPNAFEQIRRIVLEGNEDPELQSESLYALSTVPAPMLYPLLVDVLEHNQQMRPLALRMLREQAGVDFGWDMKAWRSWLNSMTAEPSPPPIVPGQ